MSIYKYNHYGDLVNFNTDRIELDDNSRLYINESVSYYNVFHSMNYLRKISYLDLQKYQNNIIIYHSKK